MFRNRTDSMKKSCLLLFAVGWALGAAAQTNPATGPAPGDTAATTKTNAASPGLQVTRIRSNKWEASPVSHTATYFGDVRVDDPQMKLTSEYLLAKKLPRANGKYESIFARTNVVCDFLDSDGKKYHVTGGQAVYTCDAANGHTNELVVVTENPVLLAPDGTVSTGETMTWDALARKLTVSNGGTVIPEHSTNRVDIFPGASQARTNRPAAPQNLH